ncbi:MAG: hypothetical protein GWO24_09845 [Akkermansiaceae bacterium]|nr:hypothetical protein [Akkermansiaceae bacterium]
MQIDSAGGYAEQTMKVMEQVGALTVPSYSFVNREALGSGALMAVAAQAIYLAPRAVIGSAGVIRSSEQETEAERQNLTSMLLAKIRTVVGQQGHNLELVQAMVTPPETEKRFGGVVVPKGTILTLTAGEAASDFEGKPLLARGIVETVGELLEKEGLSGAGIVTGAAKARPEAGKTTPPRERQGVKREEGEDQKEDLPGKIKEESFQGKIVVVKIGESDLVNTQSFKFWRRMLRRSEDEKAVAVIFDIDTPGGYAFKTKEMMTEITRLKVPSFAFVNEDALSAGALVSVATDGIYMNPDSLIGAAGLVSSTGEIEEMMRKKLHSVFEAHVRSVAEKKGYDPELIRAMMIPDEKRDRVFGEVVVKKGELLTLTASEATSARDGKPLLAKGIVTTVEELAEREGLRGVEIVRAEPTPFEKFAWWVAKYSFLLILVGMGAAYAEMKAPGFGIGGAISLAAFGIFFFGNYVAGNLAGYEMVALFVLGIILILVEIFLIPGTGITGIAGAVCIVAALLFGMVDKVEWGDWKVGEFTGGLLDLLRGPVLSLSSGLLGGSILILILMRFLPDVPVFKFLMVEKELAGGASLPETADAGHEERIGWTGETLTDLRPAGKAQFGTESIDVVAEGAYIAKGTRVRILEEDGMRVVVSPTDAA